MVVDQQPGSADLVVHVCCERRGSLVVGILRAGDVFCANNPGDVSFGMYGHFAGVDFQVGRVFEDVCPTLADGLPTSEHFPTRMDATYPGFLKPNGFHGRQVLSRECLVKSSIHFFDSSLVIHAYAFGCALSYCSIRCPMVTCM